MTGRGTVIAFQLLTKQGRAKTMRLMETSRMDDKEWTPVSIAADHGKLTNEQLHELLCVKIPRMASVEVTDDIRETVIAMISISD
jgi:hypothetical protein